MAESLNKADLRVQVDSRNEKLNFKIREAQLEKIPCMLVVGRREAEQGGVSPRTRAAGDMGFHTLDAALEMLVKEASWPERNLTRRCSYQDGT